MNLCNQLPLVTVICFPLRIIETEPAFIPTVSEKNRQHTSSFCLFCDVIRLILDPPVIIIAVRSQILIADFWVRGIGTFGANSSALVLIDGLEGDLNTIDPADVESFSILKDASATAVYGVRGANGVVLVNTKKGLSGKIQITGRFNTTLSVLNRLPKYLGAYEYAQLANEARAVRNETPLYDDTEMGIIRDGLDPDLYPNVKWQDEILNKTFWRHTYYVSGRGGSDVARYFLSLRGKNESAAYKVDKNSIYSSNVSYNTYNYRINLDVNLTKSTKVYLGSDGFLSQLNQPGVANTEYTW